MKLKKNITTVKVLDLWDVDINNILVFSKINLGEETIDYLYDDYKIRPLHIMLPRTKAHGKSYNGQTKWMYFLIEDGKT